MEAALSGNFDAIFCDIKMPKMDGIEVLDTLAKEGCESSVIMISGHGTIDTAVECIKKGAFDFIENRSTSTEYSLPSKMPPTRLNLSKRLPSSRKR